MKVKVKRNLIIFYKPSEWDKIKQRIIADFGQSVMLLSWRTKQKLGFTVREHLGLVPHSKDSLGAMGEEWKWRHYYENQIHLDFYNEAQQTWFTLKYLNPLSNSLDD
jgi:hypothetical protein